MEDDNGLLDELVLRRRKRKCKSSGLVALAILVLSVFLLGVGFVGGLFAGREIYGSGGEHSSSESNLTRQTPDWGTHVNASGKTESVLQWLDSELQPEKIEKNLR